MTHPHSVAAAAKTKPDVSEYGAPIDGVRQKSDRRLYFQLQTFTGAQDIEPIKKAIADSGLNAVLYSDVNDPYGIGVVIAAEDPNVFVSEARCLYNHEVFEELQHRPEMTMIGRTYGLGREQDLENWLLKKQLHNCLDADWPWAIWYPLRRKPEFEFLDRAAQGKILMEHGMIGRAYGEAGLARDVRLASHGLDLNDNEFLIGLIGKELAPLSKIIQEMRRTEQTSKYIQSLGPFFVGKAVYQSAVKA